MAERRRLRFLNSRGYNGAIIARGALIDVTEPWASRFIADGTAVEEKAKDAGSSEPKKPAEDKPKPAPKGTKKNASKDRN